MASNATSAVLIAGATTPIGHALTRLLAQRGHPVRVLTRAPHAPALQGLEGLGAELLPFPEDPGRLWEPCAAAETLVLVAPMRFEPNSDVDRLMHLVDAAGAAASRGGPRHLVLVSAASADEGTGVPHFEACHRLEKRAAGSGVPFSVLRPVLLMESLLSPPLLRPLAEGRLELPLLPWRRTQWVAALDVAEAAARVVEEPASFSWRALGVVGDVKSPTRAAAALSEAVGRQLEVTAPPPERLLEQEPEWGALFAWLQDHGHHVDIDAVRAVFPALPVGSMEAWAQTIDLELLGAARAPLRGPARGPIHGSPST